MMRRMSATGARLVVANIPDVTVIPYLTSAEDVAARIGLPLGLVGPALGLRAGDYVIPDAFPLIGAILTGVISGPLPPGVVLDAEEVATIRAATATFNAIIAEQARLHGAALVDMHGWLNSIKAQGLVLGGQRLTAEFLGGIFSLDGFHPSNTGAAGAANEFIRALNTHFAAGIPPVNLREVQRNDPLVLPGVGHPASALGGVDPETAGLLRAVFKH
jgi:hypothetical protein